MSFSIVALSQLTSYLLFARFNKPHLVITFTNIKYEQ